MRTEERSKSRPRLEALLAAGHRERGAEPEEGRLRLLDEPPLEREVGIRRIAVDHHDRRAQEQCGDERVPHHPGGRREPLEPVSRPQVPAEAVVLQVLERGCRRGSARSPSAGRSCRRRRARRAGARTATARTRAARSPRGARPRRQRPEVRRRHLPGTERGRRSRGLAGLSRISATCSRAVDELLAVAVAARRRGGPSARAARAGGGRCARRTPAGRSPRSRPDSRVARKATSVSGMFGR